MKDNKKHRMIELSFNGIVLLAVRAEMTVEDFLKLKDPAGNSIIPQAITYKLIEFETK